MLWRCFPAVAVGAGAAGLATIVHHATLEALGTAGRVDEVASNGIKATEFGLGTRPTSLINPDVETLLRAYTRNPYGLVIPHTLTERVLEQKLANLGITIHAPLKVVGLKQNAESLQYTDVTLEGGRAIAARYVVGADVARSVVRTTAGIGFSDQVTAIEEKETILADVTFDGADEDNLSLTACISSNTSVSGRMYRIGYGFRLEDREVPRSISKHSSIASDRCLFSEPSVIPGSEPTSIKEIVRSSRLRYSAATWTPPSSRVLALGYHEKEEPFLVGDAAHIHSPIAGQGMILDFRDAIFHGEALAKHIKASEIKPLAEADEILLSYMNEAS